MVLPLALVHGFLALTASAQVTTADLVRAEEQSRLNACLAMQKEDPTTAYEDGLAWLMEGNRPAARYCTATSLIELGKYAEGAARLEAIATAPDGGSVEDRSVYLTQAGNAWMLAGLPDAAIVSFTDALTLNAFDPSIYEDRARAHLLLEQWEDAETDLDEALQIDPGNISAYILRARAHLEQSELDAAMEDVVQARGIDETNVDALLLRGEIRQAQWASEEASE